MSAFITKSASETQKMGSYFAKKLHGGDTVCLFGNLGSGKTTFVQGLADGLGMDQRIISPTFIIIKKYELRIKNYGPKVFYHIDLYRTEAQQDFENLGLQEILSDQEAVVAIEWAEKLGQLLPEKRWEVRCEYLDERSRKIIIKND